MNKYFIAVVAVLAVIAGGYLHWWDGIILGMQAWFDANKNNLVFLALAIAVLYILFREKFWKNPKGIHVTTTEALNSLWTHGGQLEKYVYSIQKQFYDLDLAAGGIQKVRSQTDGAIDVIWLHKVVQGFPQLPEQTALILDCKLVPIPAGTRLRGLGKPFKLMANNRQVDMAGLEYAVNGSARRDILDVVSHLQSQGYSTEEQAMLMASRPLTEGTEGSQAQKK